MSNIQSLVNFLPQYPQLDPTDRREIVRAVLEDLNNNVPHTHRDLCLDNINVTSVIGQPHNITGIEIDW